MNPGIGPHPSGVQPAAKRAGVVANQIVAATSAAIAKSASFAHGRVLSVPSVIITFRVMSFHHAERDGYTYETVAQAFAQKR